MTKEQFIDQLLELNAQGDIDAYHYYRTKTKQPRQDETELEYIIRHAGADFDKGEIKHWSIQNMLFNGLPLTV